MIFLAARRHGKRFREAGFWFRYEYKGTLRRKQMRIRKGVWTHKPFIHKNVDFRWEFNPHSKIWQSTQRKNR